MKNQNKIRTFEECEPNRHKQRDNKFGVTWCVKCGRLFTKLSGKQLKQTDKINEL